MTIARIRINGTDDYLLAGGKDLGNFTGPGFVHQNVDAAVPANPSFPAMKIYFRNDLAPSTRGEVMIELWRSGDLAAAVASNAPFVPEPEGITAGNIMTPFTIEAFDANGNPVADHLGRTVVTAPTFWWGARYCFHTGYRPFVKAMADLVAQRLIAPRGTNGIPGTFGAKDFSKFKFINPMDLAGTEAGGGTTGERDDIGDETEIAANAQINPGDPVAIAALLAWGDASMTWPHHWRDDATGAPINKVTYPHANNYGWPKPDSRYQGSPDIFTSWDIFNAQGQNQSGVTPDTAHLDSLCDILYHLTGDSRYLEELQFTAMFCLIINNQAFNGKSVTGTSGGTRSMAWAQGAVFKARCATREAEKNGTLPPWLLTLSMFDELLANDKAFYENWTLGTSLGCTVFHFIPGSGAQEPWQGNFMGVEMLMGVIQGNSQFKQIAEWAAMDAINWAKSVPAFCDPYYYRCFIPSTTLDQNGTFTTKEKAPDDLFYPDIGTSFVAWALGDIAAHPNGGGQLSAADLNKLLVDPLNGGTCVQQNGDYVNYRRGTVALAAYAHSLGVVDLPEAAACLARLNRIVQSLNGGKGYAVRKWAFLPSPDGSMPAYTPLPAPAPLPSPASVVAAYPELTIPVGVTGYVEPAPTTDPTPDPTPTPDPVPTDLPPVTLQTILAKAEAILAEVAP